jgi:hypothetical protein
MAEVIGRSEPGAEFRTPLAGDVDVSEQPVQADDALGWGPPRGHRRVPPRKFAKLAAHPRRVIGGAVASGVVLDLAVRQPQVGVAWAAWCAVILVAVAVLCAHRGAALVAFAAASLFVPWFVVRSSPWLLVPNTVALLALLGYGADLAAGGPVRRSVGGLTRVALSSLEAAVECPRFLGRTARDATKGWRRPRRLPWRGIGRSVAIAGPVVFVLFLLLVSGDALFAATFDGPSVDGVGFDHFAIVVLGAWLFGIAATMATAPSRAPVVERDRRLRGMDAAVLLGGVGALFLVYAVVQLSALMAGGQYVREQTGLTYAEYARTGFFQLMAAAAISFVVLCVVRPTVQRAETGARLLRWLVGAVVVLTNGLVVGSIVRIQLYSDVFGLTHLRLYTVVAAVWLGVVVLLAGVAAIRRGPGDWMAVTASAAAALAVLAMNVVNPDQLVARENIGRASAQTARFDAPYLSRLSDDAVPWIVDHLDEVPAGERAGLVAALCADARPSGGWAAWNASASAADEALAELCG